MTKSPDDAFLSTYPCHSVTHICIYKVNNMHTQFWLAQGLMSERDKEDEDIMTVQGNISPILLLLLLLLLLPLALQPTVGFGLLNNILPFFPIYHHLSPSSQSQHLKISFYFLFPSFPGSSPSSCPFQFLGEDLFGHPILLHSLRAINDYQQYELLTYWSYTNIHYYTHSLQYKAKSNLYNNWYEIIKLQYQQQRQYHSRIKIMKRHKNQFCWMHIILQDVFHLQTESWISTQIGQWNCT